MEVEKVTLCPTKAGKGYKIAVNDEWFYTSTESLLNVVFGKAKSCTFGQMKDDAE
jgi:hypothetical protein